MQITIHTYQNHYANEIATLYHASVHAIDPAIYCKEQQEAWAPTPPDYGSWEKRLSLKKPFVAMVEGRIVGFIELEKDGHIDCAYTHPAFQKQGVMTLLYEHVLTLANHAKMPRLYVEASLLIKPFFQKHGFITLHSNTIIRNGCTLINETMEKKLL